MKKRAHTQVPNELIEEYMADLRGSELKVLLCICRKTIGWHKEVDNISTSQLMKMTGLSNTAVIDASSALENKGIISCVRKNGKATVYKITCEESSQVEDKPMKKVNSSYEESSQITYEESSHTKEINKETLQKKYTITSDASKKDDQKIDYASFVDKFNELYDKSLRVTDDKRKNIRARLKTFTGAEILQAWQNRLKDEWLNGEGKKYLKRWGAAMRNDEKIENYLDENIASNFNDNSPMPLA